MSINEVIRQSESRRSLCKNRIAVILCGGRGSRLGPVTESLPKSLVKIHDKPILWYTFLQLYKHGFRHFIFPLGYKGDMIEEFITQEFRKYDCQLSFVKTGKDTPIARRLQQVAHLIPEHDDFFLLNGDTFFDFNIDRMYQLHRSKNAFVTLSSVEIISTYGIIIEEDGKITDFARETKVSSLSLGNDHTTRGYVNAGLVWLNKDALQMIDLEACNNLEHELYPKIIQAGRAAHYKIDGDWFAIDTPKDLDIINLEIDTHQKIGEVVKELKKDLVQRYSYQTRYFNDVNNLKEQILNKTIIPHQVEVQPGPKGQELCWLRCPYCYGNTSRNTGERLSDERYVEILKQIGQGGVKKIVFAGYATDPLNYDRIEDLLQVPIDYNQIFGFHTKALRLSDRFIKQITEVAIEPMSYCSISVDSGCNETYNKVHGVPKSKAKMYDKVLDNIRHVVEARKETGAPLDLSATYLINSHNNSTNEVMKSIHDLRHAGVDIIRFTFPQLPRGYTAAERNDSNIPNREEILEYLRRLRPVIENENNKHCQVLIMDLDADYDIYLTPRTLPCFARFIFPSIGFDGWLSHCSESAAPHFREMALGNLNTRDFWEMFYDYDIDHFQDYLKEAGRKMNTHNCKCDRKEHVVNARIRESGVFHDVS